MSKLNEIIEWDDCGSTYSLYVKHFVDDQGAVGMRMLFEDVTRQKVTEINIPARKFPAFIQAVNIRSRSGLNI